MRWPLKVVRTVSRVLVPGLLVLVGLAALLAARPRPSPEAVVRDLEKEMAARPAEAFAIARRGADQLAGQPDVVKRLFRTAAQRQRDRLTQLSKDQVVELADVYARTLDDPKTAEEVRRRWLRQREAALPAGDARGRVELAQLVLDWFSDREWAARLCLEAIQLDPQSNAASDMLQHQLDYELTEGGWMRRSDVVRAGKSLRQKIQRGMTPYQVRGRLGPPKRVGRQILYKRYLEQWTYDGPGPLIVEFDCVKGQEAHVLNVHQPNPTKP